MYSKMPTEFFFQALDGQLPQSHTKVFKIIFMQQSIRIAIPYANSSFTKRCSHWFISDSATESLSKHCGHTGMPDP